ncbi:MAG: LecA/PA-IL family lectin [bacterium]|nr:LecA/PA-IL family lectin [bacterium]
MALSRTILAAIASLGMIAVVSISAFADTIRLKDGSIIKGRITTFTDGRFVVVIGEGERRREMSFSVTDVESVSFDNPGSARPAASTSAGVQKPPPRVIVSDTSTAAERQPARVDPPVVNTQARPQTAVPPTQRTSSVKPIEVSVRVLADNSSNGWTNSGWVVKKGQRIRITGTGEISLGKGNKTAPGGLYELEDGAKLLKAVPTGALIAVIGDDNNDFIYIGASREFIAARDGALFLGVNEGNLNDNTGAFEVKVEIDPQGE